MANNLLLVFAIFSLFVIYALPVHSNEEFVVDAEGGMHKEARYLEEYKIKNGAKCDAANNICDGVSANNGKAKLQCCTKFCRNILGDENNCGACGTKCKFVERCCGGKCVRVMEDANRCGHCDKKCKPGVQCKEGDCEKSSEL